jgi:SAM-dependent methyltransferase
MRKELLLGCGPRREKVITFSEIPPVFTNLVTVDIIPDHSPDVVHDLSVLPYPFEDEEFDEVHAYEVLEHTGRQGDWKFFFAQFSELWRIIKPKGYLMGSCPSWDGEWAWADPGHTRVITPSTLMFLDQEFYEREVGKTAASDYRSVWKHDFKLTGITEKGPQFFFVMQKA